MINGAGGVGKSFIIAKFTNFLDVLQVQYSVSAITAIACYALNSMNLKKSANTVHSVFGLPTDDTQVAIDALEEKYESIQRGMRLNAFKINLLGEQLKQWNLELKLVLSRNISNAFDEPLTKYIIVKESHATIAVTANIITTSSVIEGARSNKTTIFADPQFDWAQNLLAGLDNERNDLLRRWTH